jgi:RNA polymerase sporulation-specific sigma factor
LKAINTFRSEKQIKLATYASRCIENEILMYIRKNTYLKVELSLDEPLNIDYDGNTNCCSPTCSARKTILSIKTLEESEDRKIIMRAL